MGDHIPSTKQSVVNFVQLVYEGILNGFYLMHDQNDQLALMEDGALINCCRYPNN